MANEVTVSASLAVRLGYLDSGNRPRTRSFSLVDPTPNKASGVADIGFAAHEALPMGDVAAAGWARFENLDETNYVEIGKDVGGTFHAVIKLKAGEFCVVRLALNAPYAKANTAAVKLDYEIYDD